MCLRLGGGYVVMVSPTASGDCEEEWWARCYGLGEEVENSRFSDRPALETSC